MVAVCEHMGNGIIKKLTTARFEIWKYDEKIDLFADMEIQKGIG